ncbi:MAG: glycosyltransferase [Candidatus Marsarchaeota archaeon]|nr:glycosyltransferase [Candidatus Marsarchaeota archaeon]
MKVYLITPVDIRYSYRATEVQIYEYAKYMIDAGIDARILVPKYSNVMTLQERKDYEKIKALYKKIPKKEIAGKVVRFPFNFNIYMYNNLPINTTIYFAYSIYDHLYNIITKPKGQKYIIAAHSMHLKDGHIIKNHAILEAILNNFVKFIFLSKDRRENIYHHVINNEEKRYLLTLGIRKENIIYIPTFIDVKVFRLRHNNSNKLSVIHIGGKQKDANVVTEVISKLKQRNLLAEFDFYFVGEEMPESVIKSSESNTNVHVLGAVNDGTKVKLLSSSDVLIVPAIETFSRTMLEGLASGLHIIANGTNPAAVDMLSLGAKIDLVRTIEEYVNALINLVEKKKVGSLDKETKVNRNVALNFDKTVTLPKIMRMFMEVSMKRTK